MRVLQACFALACSLGSVFYARGQNFFISNAFLDKLDVISQLSGQGYELAEERDGLALRLFLYKDGSLVRRDVIDGNGQVAVEEYFKKGKPLRLNLFDYNSEGRLVTLRLYAEGFLKSRSDFLYREGGSLWRVLKGGSEVLYDTFGERIAHNGSALAIQIFTDGRLTGAENYDSGELATQTDYYYGRDGKLVSAVFQDDKKKQILSERFDAKGRVIDRLFEEDDNFIERRYYSYADDGRLLSETFVLSGLEQRSVFSYEGNEIVSESVYENGILQRILYYDGAQRSEEYYHEGRLVLRLVYGDDRLMRRETF